MPSKTKKSASGLAGFVAVMIIAGLAITFSAHTLVGGFYDTADASSLAAAKKKAVKKKAPVKKKVIKKVVPKKVAKPAAKPAAPAAAPAPSAPPTVSVHTTDFVLKCGINGDKTLKAGDDTTHYRDLQRYNCIQDDIIEIWKKEFRDAAAYPDAEIQKRTGAKPEVLETNKNNGSVKYRYNFSGNAIVQWQGDRFEGDSKCWYIDMWDYRKGGGAGGKKWSIEGGQGGSLDCVDTTPAPAPVSVPTPEPAPAATAEPATSDHTADITLKCGSKDIMLQFVDTNDHVKDGIWPLNDKRKDCVGSILNAWREEFKFVKGKTYPEALMKQKLGVSPVAYVDTFYDPAMKIWKYYFSGDSILKALGDKFAPADAETGLKGSTCYVHTVMDGRALPKIAASDIIGMWTTSWRENGTVSDNPTCAKK